MRGHGDENIAKIPSGRHPRKPCLTTGSQSMWWDLPYIISGRVRPNGGGRGLTRIQ
jgi:hypothetical protein